MGRDKLDQWLVLSDKALGNSDNDQKCILEAKENRYIFWYEIGSKIIMD